MRNLTWNRFPIKTLLIDSLFVNLVIFQKRLWQHWRRHLVR